MTIDTIGRVANQGVQPQQTSLNLNDFLKIFLTQLNFQDPLKPVDNREFLAQLAQFSSLELSKEANDTNSALFDVTGVSQSVGLLGHDVQIQGSNNNTTVGQVIAVQIGQDGSPQLTLRASDGSSVVGISPAQVTLVR